MDISVLLALITAITSLIVSIFSVISTKIERNKIKTETITKNRMDWIKDVRKLLMDFICVYLDSTKNTSEKKSLLMIIKGKISLYFRNGVVSYDNLLSSLDRCIDYDYCIEDYESLITNSQRVLSDVWVRMKDEAGITKRNDRKFDVMFGNIK